MQWTEKTFPHDCANAYIYISAFARRFYAKRLTVHYVLSVGVFLRIKPVVRFQPGKPKFANRFNHLITWKDSLMHFMKMKQGRLSPPQEHNIWKDCVHANYEKYNAELPKLQMGKVPQTHNKSPHIHALSR